MKTQALIAIVLAVALTGCGNPKSKFVSGCAQGGMSREICTCVADDLSEELDGRSFSLLANASGKGPAEVNKALSNLPAEKQGEVVMALASATASCAMGGFGGF